jgi:ribulose-phosphate 3-epimerase
VHFALQAVREKGMRAGLAVNPATPLAVFETVGCDLALCMTVNPGWGGQRFIPESVERIRRLRAILGPDVPLEVDGGIDSDTAGPCAQAGATLLVAGLRRVRRPGSGRGVRPDQLRARLGSD